MRILHVEHLPEQIKLGRQIIEKYGHYVVEAVSLVDAFVKIGDNDVVKYLLQNTPEWIKYHEKPVKREDFAAIVVAISIPLDLKNKINPTTKEPAFNGLILAQWAKNNNVPCVLYCNFIASQGELHWLGHLRWFFKYKVSTAAEGKHWEEMIWAIEEECGLPARSNKIITKIINSH